MCGYIPNNDVDVVIEGNKIGDTERLRDAAGVEDKPTPTHRCATCHDYDKRIESCPVSTYSWCPLCESVNRFVRLDRLPE